MTRTTLLLASMALLIGCEPKTVADQVGVMDQDEVERVQQNIRPTRHFVAMADREKLWSAVQGYMERVFSLSSVEKDYLETDTVEWDDDRLPHRTRVSVEVVADDRAEGNAWIYVTALKIEPVVALENARTGEPLQYGWTLAGSRPQVEEVVMGQILRRYLLLRDGRDPDSVPLEGPIPGLTPKSHFYRSGVAGAKK